jgi:F-type H+-transporting ATPase subunit delta
MTSKTAANRYAKALLDVAVSEKADLEQMERGLSEFVNLFQQHPTLEKARLNPAVPVQRKVAVVAELIARGGTPPMVGKLLALLAERDRLVILPDLLAAYRERLRDHQNVVRAEVTTTTATPLPPDRAKAIERRLAEMTGRTVMLETNVDPSIIGGVVARIGSTVYDGSLTRQLDRMKQRLVESV